MPQTFILPRTILTGRLDKAVSGVLGISLRQARLLIGQGLVLVDGREPKPCIKKGHTRKKFFLCALYIFCMTSSLPLLITATLLPPDGSISKTHRILTGISGFVKVSFRPCQ